ncbi:MAG: hypothetical protein IJE89_06195 [Bacilli bacterium]|nr:hypothetical protein [Bacilli bacterium]
MDYIYDIVLNFQNEYYDFFEWKNTDKVINIKKIPVYLVNDNNYLDLKYNEVILDREELPHSIKMFLVTNGREVLGLLLDKEGRIIKKSSLLFEEADEVLEEKETIKTLPLKYKKNITKPHISYSRLYLEKRKFLQKYFSKIDINQDEYLLKYIYYDIFKKEEDNINKVYKELKSLINININKIYQSIKRVSIELKK